MNIAGFFSQFPGFASAFSLSVLAMASAGASAQTTKPTILLVHGAWADSSSWNGVVDLLLKDGYDVRALPNTLRGLEADAAVASANAPNVKALVFVDAFAPDAGESVQSELASAPPPPPDFTIAVPFATPAGNDADLYVNSKYFGLVFASAESPEVAARLAVTQRPFAARCLTDKAPSAIGWKTIPSWFVIGDADKVIPPDILLKFATRAKSKVYHVPGGDHPSMIGHPEITVAATRDAASAVVSP